MLHLHQLAIVAIAAIVQAGLSMLLNFCFLEGNIFSAYLPFLAKIMLRMKPHLYKDVQLNLETIEKVDERRYVLIRFAEDFTPLFKPLGGCVTCMNVWLAAGTFFFWYFLFDISLWLYIPYVLLSGYYLRLLER